GFDADYLDNIIELRNLEELEKLGGIEKIAFELQTDLDEGISDLELLDNYKDRIKKFGKNVFPRAKIPNIFRLFFNAMKDTMIVILIFMALISIVLNCSIPKPNW